MKRIINGERYDTETAEVDWDNGYYGGDFKRCEETLSRTKKGAWFSCGEAAQCPVIPAPWGTC